MSDIKSLTLVDETLTILHDGGLEVHHYEYFRNLEDFSEKVDFLESEFNKNFVQVSPEGFSIEFTGGKTLKIYFDEVLIYKKEEGEIQDFSMVENYDRRDQEHMRLVFIVTKNAVSSTLRLIEMERKGKDIEIIRDLEKVIQNCGR